MAQVKHRVTFLIPKDAPPVTPDNFNYDGTKLEIKSVKAVRQDRYTIRSDLIQPEIAALLNPFLELHARWISPYRRKLADPFAASLPAGLHILVKKASGSEHVQACDLLDPLNRNFDCNAYGETVTLPNGYEQIYIPFTSLAPIKRTVQSVLCTRLPEELFDVCRDETEKFNDAYNLDVDYNAIAKDFKVTVLWDKNVFQYSEETGFSDVWDTLIEKVWHTTKTEVGILDQRDAVETEDIHLGGVLSVLGESKELKPVMIQFASRHHAAYDSSFNSTFNLPTGLHPKIKLHVKGPSLAKPPADDCTLNAYFTLPKYLFIDKYQLSDKQFLASLGLNRLVGVYGETDLEAPSYTQKPWGSAFIVELSQTGDDVDVIVPLHSRYIDPEDDDNTTVEKQVPMPVVFFACPTEFSSGNPEKNPFDRTHLGFEHFFDEKTIFYHFTSDNLLQPLQIPTLGLRHANLIRNGTVAVVITAFFFIIAMIISSLRSRKTEENIRKKKE